MPLRSVVIQPPPTDWRDLQHAAAQILVESGVSATTDQVANTARGRINIDVLAWDEAATPPQQYFLECKYWRRGVSKNVVHAFRTVVGDSGANWGAIVALNGFQKGATDAARYTNIRLLAWPEFQALFAPRWFERYFVRALSTAAGPLIEYTEPINSRIGRKATALPRRQQRQFHSLRDAYQPLTALCILFSAHSVLSQTRPRGEADRDDLAAFPDLPLRTSLPRFAQNAAVTAAILDALYLRHLLAATAEAVTAAVAEFDALFRGRA
jgi:restriction system protein